jgi:hypothetical protein
LYRLNSVLVVALIVSFISLIVHILLLDRWSQAPLITLISGILAVITFLGALASLPFNLPLLVKVRRQKLRLQHLGLSDAWEDFFKVQMGRGRWGAVTRKIELGLGLLLILAGILMLVADSELIGLFLGGFGLIFVVFYFLQEGKLWLDILASRTNEISDLKAKFSNLSKQGTARVAIPTDLIVKFAQIQKSHILTDRANAIANFKSAGELFSVLTSRKILDQKAELNIDRRLKTEEAIEELMQDPRPAGARTDSETGLLSYPVAGADLDITYAIDENDRRLRLLELRQDARAAVARAHNA